ncbi:MAG: hypothetical protein AAFZ11_00910 [Pseudomonadota bacterium]
MTGDPTVLKYAALAIGCIALVWAWLYGHQRTLREQAHRDAADEALSAQPGLGAQLHTLNHRVGEIERDVKNLDDELDGKASKADVEEAIRAARANQVVIEQIAAVLPDMRSHQRAMSDKVSDLASEVSATRTSVGHAAAQLDRIMQVIVPKGMEK